MTIYSGLLHPGKMDMLLPHFKDGNGNNTEQYSYASDKAESRRESLALTAEQCEANLVMEL